MRPGDPNAAGNSRKNLRSSVEASLRRLRTDYLDLLWVHAWDYTTPVEEVMRGLDDLVSAGKVNHVALSDAPAWVASAANTLATLRGWSPLVALQAEISGGRGGFTKDVEVALRCVRSDEAHRGGIRRLIGDQRIFRAREVLQTAFDLDGLEAIFQRGFAHVKEVSEDDGR